MSDKEVIERLDKLAAQMEAIVEALSQKRFVSREEYATAHGISPRTVDRAIRAGRLEHRRAGSRVLIPINAEIRVTQSA